MTPPQTPQTLSAITRCASLLVSLAVGMSASAASYTFVNIADDRGPFEGFYQFKQAVSDTGTVAFIGDQSGVARTYVGDGASITSIVPNLSPPAGFSNTDYIRLNGSGVAVREISRFSSSESKVLLYETAGTRTIAEAMGSATQARYVLIEDINDSGAVAISSLTYTYGPIQNYERSITRWFNGTSTTLLETAEGFKDVSSIRLNEQGEVAFHGWKEDGEGAYYRTDGTTLTRIADSTGPLAIPGRQYQGSRFDGSAINDSGAVAFWAPVDAGGEGIFVGDGGPLTTIVIADPTTPFNDLQWTFVVDINNQGTVAFFAGLWDGRRGIFTGPDPASDKVVAHGDLLFGQFVTGLGRPHLNNRGDIAFWYEVRDPREPTGYRTGIALALAESAPAVLDLRRVGNELWLRLTGQVGATYDIEQSLQLLNPAWTTIQTVTLTNASQQILLSPPPSTSAFWRARRR